jgi:hypothetical protein
MPLNPSKAHARSSPWFPFRTKRYAPFQHHLPLEPLRLGLGQGGEKVKGQHLHRPDLGTFPFAASPEMLPVRYQGPPQVRPGKDLEEGLLELLRVQAVQEEGEDGVARGLAQAEVG